MPPPRKSDGFCLPLHIIKMRGVVCSAPRAEEIPSTYLLENFNLCGLTFGALLSEVAAPAGIASIPATYAATALLLLRLRRRVCWRTDAVAKEIIRPLRERLRRRRLRFLRRAERVIAAVIPAIRVIHAIHAILAILAEIRWIGTM